MLVQVRFDQFARLARMISACRRADHLKLPPRLTGSGRAGEQLARIAVLGILVPGQMRCQRSDREHADAGRFRCDAFEQ
jgi:hypothetical protein